MSSPDEIPRIRQENFERAVDAIREDDVDALKNVLDVLPEFNTMCPQYGNNLLHLSCVFRKKKVVDYLLNLNCFDLDAVDTALIKAMFDNGGCDYFCVKLIDAGADVSKIFRGGKTYLHHAMHHYFFETAKPADPNAQDFRGRTPLHAILHNYADPEVNEGVGLLLEYGADTAILDDKGYLTFDRAIICGKINLSVQEHLFYCTFDSHSADYEMQSDVLHKLLDAPRYDNVSPLFDNVMDVVSDVISEEYFPVSFFKVPPDILKKFIKKYQKYIRRVFSSEEPDDSIVMDDMNINNIEILLNSEFHFETVELISKLELNRMYLNSCCQSREERSSLILYLVSYGCNVTSYDCQMMHWVSAWDNGEVFRKMLLHLDCTDTSKVDFPMIEIIVDIHCDLNTILAKFDRFPCYKIEPLLDYFANPELRLLCENSGKTYLVNKAKQLPRLPSLVQLARDVLRRHIVRRYNLQKTGHYYWVLRRLKIGPTYEEILSFKTKLYG